VHPRRRTALRLRREGELTVRPMFTAYLLFIVAGLAYCIAMGVAGR
jgi:hypothetical protein